MKKHPRDIHTTSVYLSFPRPRERCPFSDLSRTTLIELVDKGLVAGLSITQPGNGRGKRLIVKKSLSDYLKSLIKKADF